MRVGDRFQQIYGFKPTSIASAPGRLEVLGNHTDYNAGLALSCAVGFRCFAALAVLNEPVAKIASTAFDSRPVSYALDRPELPAGDWANYVLGIVAALRQRGIEVPGFALLVDSAVPRSAGVSSSAALEMAVVTGLCDLINLELPAFERARIGQASESLAVGAQTGLLDQLSSLYGQPDHLLSIDFQSLESQAVPLPDGWCFVAVDSGVKHDLTAEYNDRRASCESAARAMGIATLREADEKSLSSSREALPEDAYRCATHVVGENRRVREAVAGLVEGDVIGLGELMFESHNSSRIHFWNSCPELDELVEFAQADGRCVGARLSGGGFGGITIHLVRRQDADSYHHDLSYALEALGRGERWSAICEIDRGAVLHPV
ncbi:MAG: galactokinase [Phycisphaeraceae bacterium]